MKPIHTALGAALMMLTSSIAQAALISYQINANGTVLNSSSTVRYFSGDATGNFGYWGLNSADNTIFNNNGGWRPLATSLFQVSDITDITYMYNNQSAWLTLSDGTSHHINANGTVLNSSSTVRYFSGDATGNFGYWGLNSADNTIFNNNGGWRPLATSLFQVSDITDITYMYNNQSAWLTLSDGTSHHINANGTVLNSSSTVRYFSGDATGNFGYWGLNSADNTIFNNNGGWRPLATSLFQVSDITDITYMYNNQSAWLTVDDGISAVPVPAAAWLFGSGLLGLISVARRKKAA